MDRNRVTVMIEPGVFDSDAAAAGAVERAVVGALLTLPPSYGAAKSFERVVVEWHEPGRGPIQFADGEGMNVLAGAMVPTPPPGDRPEAFYVNDTALSSWSTLAAPPFLRDDSGETGVLARALGTLVDAYRYARDQITVGLEEGDVFYVRRGDESVAYRVAKITPGPDGLRTFEGQRVEAIPAVGPEPGETDATAKDG